VEDEAMFEHSLIDLETSPRPRRRWISLPIAVGLHLVGLTTFAFASYWSVGEVPEPQFADVFFLELPPPQPPPGGGGQRPPVTPPETDRQEPPVPQVPVQPTEESVPDDVPTPTTPAPVDDLLQATGTGDEGPAGSDGPGCAGCPPGPGVGDGREGPGGDGPGGPGTDSSLPIRIRVGMTRPEVIHEVQPRYTELARRAGTQGTVVVEAVIDEQGRVTGARVLRGLPHGLDRAAVDAIEQWRYKPATLAGQPVKVYFVLTVNFTIQR
jgi:periplasmic protein TonB